MQDLSPQPPKEGATDPSLLSLGSVKCDRDTLFKVRADGSRVLEFPLSRIQDLRYEATFRFGRLLAGIAWGAAALIFYLAAENPWIKWPFASLCAVVAFGTLIELYDKVIRVRTGDGEYVVDVEDSESEYDGRAFVKSVEFRVQACRTRV